MLQVSLITSGVRHDVLYVIFIRAGRAGRGEEQNRLSKTLSNLVARLDPTAARGINANGADVQENCLRYDLVHRTCRCFGPNHLSPRAAVLFKIAGLPQGFRETVVAAVCGLILLGVFNIPRRDTDTTPSLWREFKILVSCIPCFSCIKERKKRIKEWKSHIIQFESFAPRKKAITPLCREMLDGIQNR